MALGAGDVTGVDVMIYLTATTPILLARAPADFRAGIDGRVARCPGLQQHPRSGTR
jgi:transposase